MPKISIITVNFNQLSVTLELLESIKRLSFKDLEVIVVDNASVADPTATIQLAYPEVLVIRSASNLGFAGGNNLGIKASKGEFLFFVNNDAELVEGTIEKLLYLFQLIPNLGIVSPKLCYYLPHQKPDIIQYAGTTEVRPLTGRNSTIGLGALDKGQYLKAVPTAYAHGAAMMLPRAVIEKAGNMPEVFFLYYEELDWCEQIKRAGYQIYIEPNALVYHKESVSVGRLSVLKTYYINRNRIFFMRRNKSMLAFFFFSFFLFLVSMPKNILIFTFRKEWQHLRAYWKAILWNYSSNKQNMTFSQLTKTPS